jgi:hypothetical protein
MGAEFVAAVSGRKIPGDDELSDHYLRWRAFIGGLKPKGFDYFTCLGTPEELEAEGRRPGTKSSPGRRATWAPWERGRWRRCRWRWWSWTTSRR